ncbi:unnamed protein product [Blepharisma stoltei]|uniref:Maturase K n=1 Tax=Blepharisma stoltei TaxID=1481888 RepID=A0AAU9J0Z9_9CILI|nr:unnamed protein product [Blepharisma stoltei]
MKSLRPKVFCKALCLWSQCCLEIWRFPHVLSTKRLKESSIAELIQAFSGECLKEIADITSFLTSARKEVIWHQVSPKLAVRWIRAEIF